MLALSLLLACKVPEDPAFEETTSRDAYFRAWCRLYAEPACVADQLAECEWDRSFADRTDCKNWMTFRISQCPGANKMFVEQTDQVRDCILQLQDFECGVDTYCVDREPTFDADACAPITAFLTENCPDASDG